MAVLDDMTSFEVRLLVEDRPKGPRLSGAEVAVTPGPLGSASYGEAVTDAVGRPFDQESWLPAPILYGGRTLRTSDIVHCEPTAHGEVPET